MAISRDTGWWVSATSKVGHPSRVGPFQTAVEAAGFADEERPPSEGWSHIRISYRSGRKR